MRAHAFTLCPQILVQAIHLYVIALMPFSNCMGFFFLTAISNQILDPALIKQGTA